MITDEAEARINARAAASRKRFDELAEKARAEGRELLPGIPAYGPGPGGMTPRW